MSDDKDLGLETLLSVKMELGVDLDADLLQACIEIQKKYQFNHDRTLSTQEMDRLLEDRVEQTSVKQTEGGAWPR